MLDCDAIIKRYYRQGTPLYRTLTVHSRQVAGLASGLARRLASRGVAVDTDFVGEASLLHDIGIFLTDADGIHCHGTEPYICHGLLGAELLRDLGLPRHAGVCERHTGAGLSLADIVGQQLPLPVRDMVPLTVEERLICYADKFFSKTHLGEPPRTLARVRQSLAKFGDTTLARFEALVDEFGEP